MRIKDSTKNYACFKGAWKYFFDKGAYLLLINVLPSLLIPFALSPTSALKVCASLDRNRGLRMKALAPAARASCSLSAQS